MLQFTELISLGIGGIVAAVVMAWKRTDDQAYKIQQKANAEERAAIHKSHTDELARLNGAIVKVITANTRAMTALQYAIYRNIPTLPNDGEDVSEAHP